MRLANPIYEVVFKYLMEDTEIACRLLFTIIGEEIIGIYVTPQEYIGYDNCMKVLLCSK